ncbi:MAG: hypothetical protein H6667_16125 [Ardenticatenaceae bacterium]|nr:hypothetical protein [Ardenticatenaceae bacterium]MCB9443639.1 hypothetical protein [Ardenticatenaceae bacterium]
MPVGVISSSWFKTLPRLTGALPDLALVVVGNNGKSEEWMGENGRSPSAKEKSES